MCWQGVAFLMVLPGGPFPVGIMERTGRNGKSIDGAPLVWPAVCGALSGLVKRIGLPALILIFAGPNLKPLILTSRVVACATGWSV
jgi:hypothetical protein